MKPYFLFLLVLLIASCSDSTRSKTIRSAPLITSSYQDDSGHLLKLTARPERIISLAPGITETLFAIGASQQMIARSTACNFPEEVFFLPSIDPQTDFVPDSMLSWEADIIFVPDGFYPKETLDQYVAQGLPIFSIKTESLQDVYRSIRIMGEITQHPEVAGALADSLENQEKLLVSRTENLIQYGTVMLIDSDPLIVAGGIGLFQELITKAGGKNRYEAGESVLYATTEEECNSMKPEYLLIPSRESQVYQLLIERYPMLYETPAAALNQVFVLNPDLIYRPGPRIVEGLRQMAQALHSEISNVE